MIDKIMKMKINIVLILCFIGLVSLAAKPVDKMKFGMRLGWQNSNLKNNGNSMFDGAYNGFFIGVFGDKQISKSGLTEINVGLTYYQVGSRYNENNKVTLHYLNLPVSFKVNVGPAYGFAGLNGAIKIGGQSYLLGIKFDADNFDALDAGVFIGAGATFSRVGVEAKYDWGLVDLTNGYKTRYFQLGLMVYF